MASTLGLARGLGSTVTVPRAERKTTLFMEKAEKARPRLLASGLPGGTEALCWENRKRGFPGPIGPPSGHPPQLPPTLSGFCRPQAARLSVHLSVCPSDHRAQASSFGAKPLSGLTPRWKLLHPARAPWPHGDKHPKAPAGGPAVSRLARPSAHCHPGAPAPLGNPPGDEPHAAGRPQPGNTHERGVL